MDASYVPACDLVAAHEGHRVTSGVERILAARRSDERVLLEGVHALKHAVRFGAEVEAIVSPDADGLWRLLAELAPDVEPPVPVEEVDPATWRRLVPRELPSPALSVARRPDSCLEAVVAAGAGRLVVLEHPRHLGNLGAAVRVAAAAGAAGLLVVGEADPWHPTAVRAAAGLQFAVAVHRVDALPDTSRPVVAVDPGGRDLHDAPLPADAVLLFGTERAGLSAGLRARADDRVSIPMRAGVSSLNLATAVGIVLYAG